MLLSCLCVLLILVVLFGFLVAMFCLGFRGDLFEPSFCCARCLFAWLLLFSLLVSFCLQGYVSCCDGLLWLLCFVCCFGIGVLL